MKIYTEYDHNTDGAGDAELARFEQALLAAYDGNLVPLAAECALDKLNVDVPRYEKALQIAYAAAFADWDRFPDSVVISVKVF